MPPLEAQTFDWSMVVKVLGILAALMTLLQACFWWAVKWLLDRFNQRSSERFTTIEANERLHQNAVRAVEKEILQLRAELPANYVRREDWIRFSAVIDAKLDAVRATLETMKEVQSNERSARKSEA